MNSNMLYHDTYTERGKYLYFLTHNFCYDQYKLIFIKIGVRVVELLSIWKVLINLDVY